MTSSTRKKSLIIGIGIFSLLLIIVGLFYFQTPANRNYSGLNMSPGWDVADNIKYGSQNTLFASEVNQAGFYTFLHGKGPFTIFVPDDKAYDNLPADSQDLLDNDPGSMRQILLYNIVKGSYKLEDLKDGMTLQTIQGDEITVTKKGNKLALNGYSYIEKPDTLSKNGVIHMTTNYLIPPSLVY